MAVLSSGSTATCFYVAHEKTAILIDAGLKFKDVYTRLNRLGEPIEYVEAIAFGHNHGDHCGGLKSLVSSCRKPVYCRSAAASTKVIADVLVSKCATWVALDDGPVRIGEMVLDTFKIKHDTVDPVGFTVGAQGKRVVIATDLGEVSESIERLLLEANLFFLESNYDVDVLGANEYECRHKDRVIENHLSNDKTAQVIAKMRPGTRAILGHISERSNSAELVQALHADNKQVTVLRSGACSELFYV